MLNLYYLTDIAKCQINLITEKKISIYLFSEKRFQIHNYSKNIVQNNLEILIIIIIKDRHAVEKNTLEMRFEISGFKCILIFLWV